MVTMKIIYKNKKMKLQLDKKDIRRILDRYYGERDGDVSYSIFYTESDKAYEARTGKKIAEMREAPNDKINVILYLDE